jgi:oligopeptide transport system substrate-binding protein
MFSGCGKKSSGSDSSGTTYRQLYSGEVQTLNYLVTSTTNDFKLSANVIDTLVEYDPYGNIQPSLAEKWEVSDDKLTYTFHLRKDQKWVDYTGKEVADVTANDFVSSMKYILTSEYESSTAELLFGVIANAEEYYNKTITDFGQVGVKAEDDYTLVYTLAAPCPYFLSSLTYVNYMPAYGPKLDELGASFGAATGPDTIYYCGAYRLSEFKPQEKHVLSKNTNNWDADKVYITTIEETYNAEASTLAPTMVSRGEVDFATISSDIIDEWLGDPAKSAMVSRSRLKSDYTYFYAFNFDPQFDESYEPANWKLAVNNENFRQSMMAALDRIKALSVSEPNTPEILLQNTLTPKTFVNLDGKDYTEFGDLAAIAARDSFDATKALAFKAVAMEELSAQGATFPIKILMKYNPTMTDWASECAVVEQQMEGVLGTDYIDIIVEAGPSENFLSETRRNGNYAFMKCNWGADYADPNTFTDPFNEENTYNFIITAVNEGTATAETANEYFTLLAAAKAQNTDVNARYEAYAKAEAFLINHAIVIPYSIYQMDYQVTKLNVYESQFASFGVSVYRYKGQKMYDKAITMEEFEANSEAWKSTMGAK